MTARASRRTFIFRISRTFSDIVLIALLAGGVAKILWNSSINTNDEIGFISVGGDIANLMAYFGFIFFGCFYFWLRPAAFWRSLHPINFGLTQLFFPRFYPTATEYWLSISIPALVGGVAGVLLAPRLLRLNPRLLLFLFVLVVIVGWRLLPWGAYRVYLLNGFGAFLIGVVVNAVLMRKNAIKSHRQERTARARQRQQSASTRQLLQNQNDAPV